MCRLSKQRARCEERVLGHEGTARDNSGLVDGMAGMNGMKYRRFGKTELSIPVISCGGMRYQQSWNSNDAEKVTEANQRNLEACIHRAVELGINHIETARGYGTSEYQLGKVLPTIPRDRIIVQTKVGPDKDVAKFIANFEKSLSLLRLDYIDIFSFHGVNNQADLEATKICLDTALKWKAEGRVRFVGFSTHGGRDTIMEAIELDVFDHFNVHWYYIFQDNWPCIEAARRRDMGVFIISPNDKGGRLYDPTEKLMNLTAPLHPMVFNGLFCLAHPEVHTLSCGVSRPEDFDIHMETVEKLDQASELIAPVVARLRTAMADIFGEAWVDTWDHGLPEWDQVPGEVNIPWILRLRNLAKAYDMVEYGKMRYNLLGRGDSWFPGNQADKVTELDLRGALRNSPHADVIPAALEEAHELLAGEQVQRLQQD